MRLIDLDAETPYLLDGRYYIGSGCRMKGADDFVKTHEVVANGNCTICGKPLSGDRVFVCEECNYEPKDEPQKIYCPKCGRSDYIRDLKKDFGVKDSTFKYKCINCNTYIKDEPKTERSK